ncbi:Dirigent protein 18 [Glycine max]|nr:Dirigent protein 18 [Glycine max]
MASTSETLGNKMAMGMGSLTAASLAMLVAFANLATTMATVDPTAATRKEHVIELYMHDILGGSNPIARSMTGLLGSIYDGQVPFAMPIGFNTQGTTIPNANGANPTVNGVFGIPLGTGLAGTSFAPNSSNNNNQNNAPLQLGPHGLRLSFGTIIVIDDILTSQPELGSQIVRKAQGVYMASSVDGTRQMMAFTALFEGGEYGDSLNFYGLKTMYIETTKQHKSKKEIEVEQHILALKIEVEQLAIPNNSNFSLARKHVTLRPQHEAQLRVVRQGLLSWKTVIKGSFKNSDRGYMVRNGFVQWKGIRLSTVEAFNLQQSGQ